MSNALALPSDTKDATLGQVIQSLRPEIQRALPAGMNADRIARLALTAVRKDPKLAKCDGLSFAGALLTASALGLEPGVNGEAYLVPYGKECQFIIGYQGMVKLYWQHPLAVDISAHAVYANDSFEYSYGLNPTLVHKPARGDRGEITDYYAIATLSTGAHPFLVLTPQQVKALRGGKTGTSGSIADPMHWMERKTVIRQLLKTMPKSTSLAHALESDEQTGSELQSAKRPDAIAEARREAIEPKSSRASKLAEADVVDTPLPADGDGPAFTEPDPTLDENFGKGGA